MSYSTFRLYGKLTLFIYDLRLPKPLPMKIIMTKTNKQLSKIALTASIFLASFEGEGKAQEYPTIIQQQCASNCVLNFLSTFASCATQPMSCLQAQVNTLQACFEPTPNFLPCTQCAPVSGQALTNYIVQQDAVNCFNAFNTGFGGCTTFSCVAPYVTTLSQCITAISGNASCTTLPARKL